MKKEQFELSGLSFLVHDLVPPKLRTQYQPTITAEPVAECHPQTDIPTNGEAVGVWKVMDR